MKHNPNKVGIVLGTLLGGFHLLWSLLILAGVGQSIIDFVFWAHMLHLSMTVGPFDPTAAVVLVGATAIGGFVVGYVATLIWNRVHR